MAYRRKQGNASRNSMYEDLRDPSTPTSTSLAEQATRGSSARRDSSLSSAYGDTAYSSAYRRPEPSTPVSNSYEYTSIKDSNDTRNGFWGVLARKAKSIIEDDHAARQKSEQPKVSEKNVSNQIHQTYQSPEGLQKNENPRVQKRLESLTSSLNYIGGKVGNALEEGFSAVENRAADIIQETRKLNMRRKGSSSTAQTHLTDPSVLPQHSADHETQLKASRDVANAMAAKAKLLMRELKTVKADLAFAKERCAQLEEENKILRESKQGEDHHDDDDMIRLQLETLLAEKARLANENSIYARENRFLREIVEYHQLTMQDVVYFDDGMEEVTEVYQITTPSACRPSRSPSPDAHDPSPESFPEPSSSAPGPNPLSGQASLASGKLSRQASDVACAPTIPPEPVSDSMTRKGDSPKKPIEHTYNHLEKKQQQQDSPVGDNDV